MIDPKKIVKSAVQSPQKAESAAEKLLPRLRDLLTRAEEIEASGPANRAALHDAIQRGTALLNSGNPSSEAITKFATELSALLRESTSGTAGKSDAAKSAVRGGTAPVKPAAAPAKPSEKPAATTAGKNISVFTDVASNAYYYDAVQWAVKEGIASGTSPTTFSPDDACTRAQTVTLLWRASGSPKPKGKEVPFKDVPADAYYRDAVLWAIERGITSGTENGTFSPDATVTRSQVATFLYRNAGSPAVQGKKTFTDVPADSYYYKAVSWVTERGISSGTSENTFTPDATCTRGQIVTFLYRLK